MPLSLFWKRFYMTSFFSSLLINCYYSSKSQENMNGLRLVSPLPPLRLRMNELSVLLNPFLRNYNLVPVSLTSRCLKTAAYHSPPTIWILESRSLSFSFFFFLLLICSWYFLTLKMTILRKFDKKSRLKKKKKKINHDNTYTDTSSRTRDNCFFNGDEKEVAKILQQLHQFILESESSAYPFLSITWGVKKRRSLTNGSQSPPPPPPLSITCYSPPRPCNCVRTISKPLSFSFSDSFSKLSTCKRKTSNKAKMKMKKSIDAITSSPQKQENQIKTFVKLMMGDCNDQRCRNLELKSKPSFVQQREKHHSNSNRKRRRRRRSFDLSSAGPTVFSPVPEEEEEEESKGSLTKVAADPSRMGSEMNEKSQYPYSQIAHSLSGEVGLVMAKHLSPLGIPDLNFAPEENFFKSFDMNKQPPLQMC